MQNVEECVAWRKFVSISASAYFSWNIAAWRKQNFPWFVPKQKLNLKYLFKQNRWYLKAMHFIDVKATLLQNSMTWPVNKFIQNDSQHQKNTSKWWNRHENVPRLYFSLEKQTRQINNWEIQFYWRSRYSLFLINVSFWTQSWEHPSFLPLYEQRDDEINIKSSIVDGKCLFEKRLRVVTTGKVNSEKFNIECRISKFVSLVSVCAILKCRARLAAFENVNKHFKHESFSVYLCSMLPQPPPVGRRTINLVINVSKDSLRF